MLRWCLSTVRALGGHDSNPRLPCCFSLRTSRRSRSQSSGAYIDAALPIVEEPGPSVAALPSAEPYPTDPRGASCLSSGSLARRSEGRHPERAACFRTSHSAVDALTRYLSSENLASDHPLVHSPTAIRSLYYRAEARNQLGMLDIKMLTLLIGIFGSLSIEPRLCVVYRVPLASRLPEAYARRTHWAFVLKVGKYKLARGMPLQDSDRFWLMCAELAMIQAKPLSKPISNDVYSAILRARTHYRIIRRHSRRPDVHAYYLEALLAVQDPRLLDFAARDLAFLLRTHRVCHPQIQRLLYRLVIQHGESLLIQSQDAILAALWCRVCQGTGTSDLVPENGLASIVLDACRSDATAIARSLSATLFGFAGHLPNDKSANSFGYLFSVLSPANALTLRWSSLILFSIFNSSEVLHFNTIHRISDHAPPQLTLCWQVIFGLATIEKILQDLPSALTVQSTTTEGILETTHSLCQLWLTGVKSCLVSRDLACAIATSFLRVAGVLADASLFYNCQELYCLDNSTVALRTPVQKLFAAQYIVTAVRVLGLLPDVVLATLRAFSPDLKQQHQVLASAVQALAPIDASLAHALYSVAQGKETEVDLETTHSLAVSFAQRGSLHQVILFFKDSRLSLEQRGVLMSAIARSLRENPRNRHPQSVLVAIVNELEALYRPQDPPEHFRGHLEQLFVDLARQGRGSQLFPVALSIFRRSSNFFQPRFFVRYCRVLIRHRQFATAQNLLNAIIPAHPKIARSLRILTNRTAMQTKAVRVFKRTTLPRGPTSLGASFRLRRCPYGVPPLERSLQELLKSGRLLAAKNIFARTAVTIPSARRIALGNILLHGLSRQPTARNGRGVRKVLALLDNLVKNHGFRPDRVTVNILIKVIISWRSAFDSTRLRELFDQLVRGGYPAAEYSPLQPPFNTRQTQFSGSSGFSTLSSFVSFEKHSRPLFKMFIKAFYLCNDVEAARKVVGILKVEEYKNAMTKEARRRARTRGRVKAAQRNVIPPDATAPSIE